MSYIPYKTFSGSALPVFNVSPSAAISAGVLVKGGTTGTFSAAASGDTTAYTAPLAVSYNAVSVAGTGTLAVCPILPDVLFRCNPSTAVDVGKGVSAGIANPADNTQDTVTTTLQFVCWAQETIEGATWCIGQLLQHADVT